MVMARRPEERLDRLERMFAEAHRARPDVQVGDEWGRTVMREICREEGADPFCSTLPRLEQLVWRAAAVAVCAAVLFAGSAAVYTSRQSDQVTARWLEDFTAGPALLEEEAVGEAR
jgi:hypothetical protein